MKTKSIFIVLAAMIAGLNVFAQEFDDMYFTAKDRTKVNQEAREAIVLTSAKEKGSSTLQTINPSDSYSARNENPDYTAGSKAGTNTNQKPSYFSSNYVPNVNQNLYNCNCNTNAKGYSNNYAYGNPYYSNYGYGMSGFGSPYSSFYPYGGYGTGSMYGMGMNPGLSLGLGYGLGSYMWGSPSMSFWNSYYGMGSYYGYGYPYSGYGMGMGYYGGYPVYTTVVNNYSADNSNIVNGRRPSRGGNLGSQSSYYNSTAKNSTTVVDANGRTRGAAAHSQYYQSGWRGEASRSGGTHTSSGARSSSSFWNSGNSNSSWNNSGWNSRSSTNWGGGNSGFGSRSSGFGGGGFSGGGGGFSGGGGGGHAGGGGRGGRH